MKILKFLLIIFTSIQCFAQDGLKIGVGMQWDTYEVNNYLIDDSLLVVCDKGGDDPRATVAVSYRYSLSTRLNIESGVRFYTTYPSYYTAWLYPPFGFVKKIGSVKSSTFNIPVNLEYNVKKWLYLKGGISTTFAIIKKSEDYYFHDLPQVNESYNSIKNIFKPVFFNYGIGLGFKVWRLDLSYYHSQSFSDISDPWVYEGKGYFLFNKMSSNQIELAFIIDFKHRSKKEESKR